MLGAGGLGHLAIRFLHKTGHRVTAFSHSPPKRGLIGSRSETVQMLEFAATHGIKAVVDVMPLARVNEAIERIRRRDVEMGLVLEG